MRTARSVIVCLVILFAGGFLPAQQAASPAQGSVDTDVTITGGDDSVIPIPEPSQPDNALELPPLDTTIPPAYFVPPVMPPVVTPGLQGALQTRPDAR